MNHAERSLPLKPVVLHILLSLARDPMHGYGIIQSIRQRTEGEVQVHTGPLYRHLRRLLDEGLIEEMEDAPEGVEDDARRGAYYRLSSLGQEALTLELRRLRSVLELGRELGVA